MTESSPIAIGVQARCTDGVCGRVKQVVIDPIREQVTHLIVEPEHREGLGKLVPIDLVETSGDQVQLRATMAEFDTFEGAEETHFLPGVEGVLDYVPEQTLLWPYFGGNSTLPVTVEKVPVGEVAVRRGEEVDARDGRIGEVEGLILDTVSHHATHLVLKEGHVFAHKDVAIPITAVEKVEANKVRLTLTKQEIEALPVYQFR